MGKKNKKKKFTQIWKSQTDIGKLYSLSAIALGKILLKHGLKDKHSKEATKKAVTEGYAILTPLKNGQIFYMWNLKKIIPLIEQDHRRLSPIEYWVEQVKRIIKEANKELDNGNDKISRLMFDTAYEEVPSEIRKQVKYIINHGSDKIDDSAMDAI